MFVTYSCNTEVIVTSLEFEAQTLKAFFKEGMGRRLEDYDRTEEPECAVYFSARIHQN